MKKTLILSLSVIFALLANATEVKVGTTEATIFPQGVQLLQKTQVSLKKGENSIELIGLSPKTKVESLQLLVPKNVQIATFQFRQDYIAGSVEEAVKPYLDTLENIKTQKAHMEAELSSVKSQLELLQSGVEFVFNNNKTLSTQQVEQSLAYFNKRHIELKDKETALNKDIEKQQAEINRLESQVRSLTNKGKQRTGRLVVTLMSASEQKAEVKVKYFAPDASWAPHYDIQIDKVGGPAKLTLKADVQQTSGFDWKSVKLTLSTAAPSHSHVSPTMGKWVLQHREEEAVTYRSANKSYAMPEPMLMAMDRTAEVEEYDGFEEDLVVAEDQQIMKEWKIQTPYTLAGNGKKQTITLEQRSITDIAYQYIALPKVDDKTYLVAYLTNWQKLGLLNGRAMLTFGNTFLGETTLNTNSVSDSLQLNLGDDPQIVVEREKSITQSQKKDSGKNRVITEVYTITVRNNKKVDVDIQLTDQYPVSSDKQIQIELMSATTEPAINNERTGKLSWNINLKAGETKTLTLAYQVKYPKEWRLNYVF